MNQVIALGIVHANITANVQVDNTLHNKQTGEGGRAKILKCRHLSQNGSLFNYSNNQQIVEQIK